MASVFVVQHLHVLNGDEECVLMIGVYGSRESALAAVSRLRVQPGFRDFPRLVDPHEDEEEEGFYVDEYEINRDHWEDGFVTV